AIMHLSLLVLLSVPVALALDCYQGMTMSGKGAFGSSACLDTKAQYCFTSEVTAPILGVKTVVKACDSGDICKDVGKITATDGSGLVTTCCKGNDCNPASSISLLMTILAAAAAAFQRL
ncbi:hypothetical protein PENTCL1PPCAC_12364, partial [Pristionchus entomophagus]